MNCPICGGELGPGVQACAVCSEPAIPRVHGALAADPRLVTPPARPRARVEGGRLPSLRRSEPRSEPKTAEAWRAEVQERVRSRRQRRAEAGLPLFDPPTPDPSMPPVPAGTVAEASNATPDESRSSADTSSASGFAALPERGGADASECLAPIAESELVDLPLQFGRADVSSRTSARGAAAPSLDDPIFEEAGSEPEVDIPFVEDAPAPLERRATPGERAQAAAFDGALFTMLAAIVVYFTARAARVGVMALAPAWPWLSGYLLLLALFYAAYFTGTTGRTPGKLLTGLRVVDHAGRPPSYLRASVRALLGLVGIACGGLGLLSMAFDPASRAAHDRVFRTRVVRD